MPVPPIFSHLAEHAVALRLADLPAAVLEKVDHCLLDLVGATYGALAGSGAAALRRHALALNPTPQATLWGTAQRAGVAEAALVHGAAGYELEYDDGVSLGGHWGSSAIPAILALAEREGATAAEAVLAIVAAYEVGTRVSRTLAKGLLERGVHFPGTMGAIAATVGAGRILRLDATTLAAALGHAALLPVAPYLPALVGVAGKNLYSGWPNLAGIHFAELARAGIGGAPAVLEGEQGLARALGWQGEATALAEQALAGLGAHFSIMETYFKPFPCCRWLHAPVQAVLDALGGEQAHAIHVRGPGFLGMYQQPGPWAAPMTAKYSLPYCVAAAARWGRLQEAEFAAAARADAGLTALAGRVGFAVDPALEAAFPDRFETTVEIALAGGGTRHGRSLLPWGPQAPPSLDALAAKFRPLMTAACGDAAAAAWVAYAQAGVLADPDLAGLFSLLRLPLLPPAS